MYRLRFLLPRDEWKLLSWRVFASRQHWSDTGDCYYSGVGFNRVGLCARRCTGTAKEQIPPYLGFVARDLRQSGAECSRAVPRDGVELSNTEKEDLVIRYQAIGGKTSVTQFGEARVLFMTWWQRRSRWRSKERKVITAELGNRDTLTALIEDGRRVEII